MPFTYQMEHEALIIVQASGKLTREDYAKFLPKMDELIKEHGKISMVFDMHDLRGWQAGAAWDDARFAFQHFHDVERLAVIGEKRWQKVLTFLSKPFTRAEVRYFAGSEAEAAQEWAAQTPANH